MTFFKFRFDGIGTFEILLRFYYFIVILCIIDGFTCEWEKYDSICLICCFSAQPMPKPTMQIERCRNWNEPSDDYGSKHIACVLIRTQSYRSQSTRSILILILILYVYWGSRWRRCENLTFFSCTTVAQTVFYEWTGEKIHHTALAQRKNSFDFILLEFSHLIIFKKKKLWEKYLFWNYCGQNRNELTASVELVDTVLYVFPMYSNL